MKLHLFANRIHRAYFSGGAVIIEFCVIRPDASGEVSPDTPVTEADIPFAISLPLGGFMRSLGELRKFAEELQKKGILKKPEGGDNRGDRMRKQGELQDITSDGGDEPLT